MAEYDQCLVITFVESTHVLAMNANEELDEASISGFVTDRMTLYCGSLDHDHTVQVLPIFCCVHSATCSTVLE
jgi:DNA damage-binding protein 1